MKFLLIAYYYGDTTNVGAQRWTKNIKYIKQLGWEPVVFTFNQKDKGFSEIEIINNEAVEPNSLYASLFKKKVPSDILSNKKSSLLTKFLVFIRSNFFIPDSRVLSIPSSKNILRKRLKQNDIDLIVSTGPPHSMHLIANALKNEFDIPWISDFRDPWTGIEYFENLPLLPIAKRIHKKLEHKILSSSDQLITVSESWAKHLRQLGAEKVTVIYNGYDPEDFEETKVLKPTISIAHFGTYPQTRNHHKLWDVLENWCENPQAKNLLSFDFYGFVYSSFEHELKDYSFNSCIKIKQSIPHKEATKKMSDYRFLYLSLSDTSLSEGRIPLKFYEYLASGRKIIATGKKGTDLSKLIKSLDCGYYINYGEEDKFKAILNAEMELLEEENKRPQNNKEYFSKKQQAQQYVNLFEETIRNTIVKK
jgi:glycosyltransferase involved in cell wall biosynthesis